MFPFSRWLSVLCAFGMTAAAAVYAQERDVHPPGPGHDPRLEAAMDDCWVEYGGEADDPVPPSMMAQCLADKGFSPPRHGPPPPPPPPDGDDDGDDDDLPLPRFDGPFAGP